MGTGALLLEALFVPGVQLEYSERDPFLPDVPDGGARSSGAPLRRRRRRRVGRGRRREVERPHSVVQHAGEDADEGTEDVTVSVPAAVVLQDPPDLRRIGSMSPRGNLLRKLSTNFDDEEFQDSEVVLENLQGGSSALR